MIPSLYRFLDTKPIRFCLYSKSLWYGYQLKKLGLDWFFYSIYYLLRIALLLLRHTALAT